MNIIFGEENIGALAEKNTILEIDSLQMESKEIRCFCLLGIDSIPLSDLPTLDKQIELHTAMIEAVKSENWEFALDAIAGLKGMFNKLLDEFYTHTEKRIVNKVPKYGSAAWPWPLIKS